MIETANILNNATVRSLILLDEVGRGTSTFDGLSIAWSVAEYLHDTAGVAARTLFATHYHEMIELALLKPRVCNLTMAVREWNDTIVFLRRVLEGAADRSYGIQVARLAGLPREVIERAKEVLLNLERDELSRDGRRSWRAGADSRGRWGRHLPETPSRRAVGPGTDAPPAPSQLGLFAGERTLPRGNPPRPDRRNDADPGAEFSGGSEEAPARLRAGGSDVDAPFSSRERGDRHLQPGHVVKASALPGGRRTGSRPLSRAADEVLKSGSGARGRPDRGAPGGRERGSARRRSYPQGARERGRNPVRSSSQQGGRLLPHGRAGDDDPHVLETERRHRHLSPPPQASRRFLQIRQKFSAWIGVISSIRARRISSRKGSSSPRTGRAGTARAGRPCLGPTARRRRCLRQVPPPSPAGVRARAPASAGRRATARPAPGSRAPPSPSRSLRAADPPGAPPGCRRSGRRRLEDPAQEDDGVVPLAHGHGQVADARLEKRQLDHLVIVRGEQGAGRDPGGVVQVLSRTATSPSKLECRARPRPGE